MKEGESHEEDTAEFTFDAYREEEVVLDWLN